MVGVEIADGTSPCTCHDDLVYRGNGVGALTELTVVDASMASRLHHSKPPIARERTAMYSGFGLPPRAGDTGAGADRLSRVRENAYKTTDTGTSKAALRRIP